MTTTASSSAQPSQASSGSMAARQSGGSAAASRPGHGQRSAVDLFANLLGLASTRGDANPIMGGSETDTPLDKDVQDALDKLLTDGSANPLADLIGWTGGPAPLPTSKASASSTASELTAAASLTGPGNSAAAGADAGQGVSLDGMTVLAQPADADANMLASLKPGAQGNALPDAGLTEIASKDSAQVSIELTAEAQAAQPTSAVRANTIAASRPANWRSTAALGSANPAAHAPASTPTSTTAIQMAQSAVVQSGRETGVATPPLRSTVALDERFTSALAAEANTPAMALGGSGQSRSSQGDAQASSEGQAGFGGTLATEINDVDAPEQAFSLDGDLLPDDPLDPNDQLNPQQLRYASVRVGEGTDEAIDIRLSMDGDAVNVNFRTDNAEVRAGLQHNAGNALSDLMQRSGLQLSGVSVDTSSQQGSGPGHFAPSSGHPSGQSQSHGPQGRGSATAGGDRSASRSAPERAPITRRADGGPALDVFA